MYRINLKFNTIMLHTKANVSNFFSLLTCMGTDLGKRWQFVRILPDVTNSEQCHPSCSDWETLILGNKIILLTSGIFFRKKLILFKLSMMMLDQF